MKKLFLLLFLLPILSMAQNEGHYSMNLKDQNIAIINVTNYFSNWFNIDDNSTFEKTKDDIDEIGMQHIVFQQYYRGTKVEHGVVFVHAQNGVVMSVNATVMELPFQSLTKQDSQLKSSFADDVEQLIVPINTKNGVIYRSAYKSFDASKNADFYIDIETSDTLKTNSHVFYDGMVDGNAYTMYHGWQPMSSYYSNGDYTLLDADRLIVTLDASNANYDNEVTGYRNNSAIYSSGSSSWGGILSSVSITGDDGDWWYTAITDTRPDFYIKIYSSTGKLIYTSEVKDNTKSPVTFSNINVSIDEGSVIKIYDEDVTSDTYGGSVTISNPLPGTYTWSGSLTSGKIVIKSNPALDAHWGMQNVYDYYVNNFQRYSYNNLGTMIYQFIDPYAKENTHSLANAYAAYDVNGTGYMCYGLGDGETMSPVVALDVMAHEYTHMVTNFNGHGGLEYIGESGALNESFSDIFGTAIEFYALGDKANWLIGEDVMINYTNMRDMANPKNSQDGELILKEDYYDFLVNNYGSEYYETLPDTLESPLPDTYKGEFWKNTSDDSEYGDHGGVHTNSGVQNKWFYLLCEGGNGTNDNEDEYSVSGIGIEKAQQIAYRNLIYYLTPTASYWDARNGSLDAAKDLYGENSAEYKAVEDAWFAVGVGSISGNADKFVVTAKAEDATMGSVMGSGLYELNEEATLIAIPENGYEFEKWNDGITTNPRKVSVTEDVTYTATFKYVEGTATATVSLFSNNNSWGTVSGAGTYKIGETVSIDAMPEKGYQFVQWSDGINQQTRTIIISDDITLIATFEKIIEVQKKNVSLYSNNNDWGILSGSGEYIIGSEVELYALPKEGYRFVQWNDGNTENPRYVTISDDLMLIATFEKITNTAINDVTNESTITILNNQIFINGIAPSYVTTILGQKIANQNLKPGCYYVQIGNSTQSVFVQ